MLILIAFVGSKGVCFCVSMACGGFEMRKCSNFTYFTPMYGQNDSFGKEVSFAVLCVILCVMDRSGSRTSWRVREYF